MEYHFIELSHHIIFLFRIAAYICILSFFTERLVSVFMSIVVYNLSALIEATPISIEKHGPLLLFVKLPVYFTTMDMQPGVRT